MECLDFFSYFNALQYALNHESFQSVIGSHSLRLNIYFEIGSNETIVEMMLRLTGTDIMCCPECGKGKLKLAKKLLELPGQSP